MRSLQPIPRGYLPDTCTVRRRQSDGTFGDAQVIGHVRFDYVQSASSDAHRFADAGSGTLFLDAVNSDGAFELTVGDRVDIDGHSYFVSKVKRFRGLNGRMHHWEVELS